MIDFSIPSVKSFVEITCYLLKLPGVTGHYFLSECLSQDPIETALVHNRLEVDDQTTRLSKPVLRMYNHCVCNSVVLVNHAQ